jgi:hypothetical protein
MRKVEDHDGWTKSVVGHQTKGWRPKEWLPTRRAAENQHLATKEVVGNHC